MVLSVNQPGWSFCQFPQFHAEKSTNMFQIRWHTDRHLHQHWQNFVKQMAKEGLNIEQEAVLAQALFQRRSPNSPRVNQHWQAWLCRRSMKAVRVLYAEIGQISHRQPNPEEEFTDLAQMALEATVNVDGFFVNFDPVNRNPTDWYAVLTAWSYQKIYGYLIDRLRQRWGQTFKRSDLGIAARSTRKRVIDALTETGLARLASGEQRRYQLAIAIIQNTPEADCLAAIACCGNPSLQIVYCRLLADWIALNPKKAKVPDLFAAQSPETPAATAVNPAFLQAMIGKFLLYLDVWQVFKTLINLRKAVAPQWPAIAAEQQKNSTLGLTIEPDQVEQIATIIGKAVRLYSDPPLTRVNLVQEDGQSLLENLPDPNPSETEDDPDAPTPLWQGASRSMAEYLAQLDPISQQVAQKLYGETMIQAVVASDLKLSQATVARYQRRILTGLVQTLERQDQFPTLSTQNMATIKPALIDWLKHHYQSSNKH